MKIIRTAIGSMVSLGLINHFRSNGIEVVGVDSDPLAFGLYLLNSSYVIPKANDPKFIDTMLNICEIEQPDAILAGPEEELLILTKNRDLFEGIVLLCPDYNTIKICYDKIELDDFFRQLSVLTPLTQFPDYFLDIDFPCIVKPRVGRGSSKVWIATHPRDIRNIKDRIIQDYIEGNEYSVDVLADREGNVCNVVPRLRLQITNGKSTRSRTVYDEEIIGYCKKIAKELKLFGMSCIQCIKNESGVYFIDVNPRFGGGSVLSLWADQTIFPNIIKLIKGEKPIPNDKFEEGLTMLRFYNETYIREGEIKKC